MLRKRNFSSAQELQESDQILTNSLIRNNIIEYSLLNNWKLTMLGAVFFPSTWRGPFTRAWINIGQQKIKIEVVHVPSVPFSLPLLWTKINNPILLSSQHEEKNMIILKQRCIYCIAKIVFPGTRKSVIICVCLNNIITIQSCQAGAIFVYSFVFAFSW